MHSEIYVPESEYVQRYISVDSSVLTQVSVCLYMEEYRVRMCLYEHKCLRVHVEPTRMCCERA